MQELNDERFYIYANLAHSEELLAIDDIKDKVELLRVRTDGFRHFWFKVIIRVEISFLVFDLMLIMYSPIWMKKQPDISGGRGPYKIAKSTLSGKDWFYR